MSLIEIVVSRKPMQVCIVNAVPTYCGSPSSVTQAENWAESATTDAPQIAATITSNHRSPPKRNPVPRQQLPLTAIAHEVITVRPSRSASSPAATQPAAPQPITKNEATSAVEAEAFETLRLARIITGIQTHIA